MQQINVFSEYSSNITEYKQYYDFGISKNFDKRIDHLYASIHIEELIQSVTYYPERLYERFIGIMREFYQLDESSKLIIDSGTESIICLVNQKLLEHKKVGVVVPHFYRTIKSIEHPILIESYHDQNSLFVTPDYIEESIRQHKLDAVWIANPNSIVGFGYKKESLIELIERHQNICFIIDETNIDFYSETIKISFMDQLKNHSNIVLLRSCSKFFGIPGARVGILFTYNEEFYKRYQEEQATFPVSGMSLILAQVAYQHYDFFRDLAKEIGETKEKIYRIINKIGGVTAYPSLTNTIFLTSHDYDLWREFEDQGLLTMKYKNQRYENAIRVTVPSDQAIKLILVKKISEIFGV